MLSDSYVQNQSIAMEGPFYENDSFQLHSRAGHSRLQINPSGSGNENAREPALPMISGFPLLHSVCHGVFHGMLFKKHYSVYTSWWKATSAPVIYTLCSM